MTIKTITVDDAAAAFDVIEQLVYREHKDLIFRGHQRESWRLQSTLRRHVVSWPHNRTSTLRYSRIFSLGLRQSAWSYHSSQRISAQSWNSRVITECRHL